MYRAGKRNVWSSLPLLTVFAQRRRWSTTNIHGPCCFWLDEAKAYVEAKAKKDGIHSKTPTVPVPNDDDTWRAVINAEAPIMSRIRESPAFNGCSTDAEVLSTKTPAQLYDEAQALKKQRVSMFDQVDTSGSPYYRFEHHRAADDSERAFVLQSSDGSGGGSTLWALESDVGGAPGRTERYNSVVQPPPPSSPASHRHPGSVRTKAELLPQTSLPPLPPSWTQGPLSSITARDVLLHRIQHKVATPIEIAMAISEDLLDEQMLRRDEVAFCKKHLCPHMKNIDPSSWGIIDLFCTVAFSCQVRYLTDITTTAFHLSGLYTPSDAELFYNYHPTPGKSGAELFGLAQSRSVPLGTPEWHHERLTTMSRAGKKPKLVFLSIRQLSKWNVGDTNYVDMVKTAVEIALFHSSSTDMYRVRDSHAKFSAPWYKPVAELASISIDDMFPAASKLTLEEKQRLLSTPRYSVPALCRRYMETSTTAVDMLLDLQEEAARNGDPIGFVFTDAAFDHFDLRAICDVLLPELNIVGVCGDIGHRGVTSWLDRLHKDYSIDTLSSAVILPDYYVEKEAPLALPHSQYPGISNLEVQLVMNNSSESTMYRMLLEEPSYKKRLSFSLPHVPAGFEGTALKDQLQRLLFPRRDRDEVGVASTMTTTNIPCAARTLEDPHSKWWIG